MCAPGYFPHTKTSIMITVIFIFVPLSVVSLKTCAYLVLQDGIIFFEWRPSPDCQANPNLSFPVAEGENGQLT
jgi:hypothetical protein